MVPNAIHQGIARRWSTCQGLTKEAQATPQAPEANDGEGDDDEAWKISDNDKITRVTQCSDSEEWYLWYFSTHRNPPRSYSFLCYFYSRLSQYNLKILVYNSVDSEFKKIIVEEAWVTFKSGVQRSDRLEYCIRYSLKLLFRDSSLYITKWEGICCLSNATRAIQRTCYRLDWME